MLRFSHINRPIRAVLHASVAALLVHFAAGAAAAQLIPDANLEKAVRAFVPAKKDNQEPINEEDLGNIFVLEGKGMGIKDLTGLEKCKNLLALDLEKNEVSNLAPIAGLTNIQSLILSHNAIVDLAPLTEFKALQHLELEFNQVESVAPLAGLEKLTSLYLSDNKIVDIAPLGGLKKLSSLLLENNQVTDVTPLENVTKLMRLNLAGYGLENIAPIAKQTELSMLFLERNKITDLAALVDAVKADNEGEKRFAPFLRLWLKENPLSDAAKTDQLNALKECGVRLEDAE